MPDLLRQKVIKKMIQSIFPSFAEGYALTVHEKFFSKGERGRGSPESERIKDKKGSCLRGGALVKNGGLGDYGTKKTQHVSGKIKGENYKKLRLCKT